MPYSQGRASRRRAHVVPEPAAKCSKERVRDDVVGYAVAETASDISVQANGVPVIDRGECFRVLPGSLDQRGVIARLCRQFWHLPHRGTPG